MKNFVGVVFVLATFLIPEHNCIVKTLKVHIGYMNPVYANAHTIQAFTDTWNDTTNYEILHWNLPKDLPKDIALTTRVYSIDHHGRKLKSLLDITIPICQESAYRWALTNFLRVPKDKLGKPCILKNNYYTLRVGQLNIEALIPNLGSKGKLFLTENRIASRTEHILDWTSTLEYLPKTKYIHRNSATPPPELSQQIRPPTEIQEPTPRPVSQSRPRAQIGF